MPGNESAYPPDWQRYAERDLSRVGHMLDAGDPEAAGYFLHQAAEKYLKAFLLSRGWQLRRTHDLQALLNEAIAFDASLDAFRLICQKVSGFYMADRYPGTATLELPAQEVRLAEREIMGLIEKLRAPIPPARR